jgi:5-methylcytosine-specific restriction endonuclease McrA
MISLRKLNAILVPERDLAEHVSPILLKKRHKLFVAEHNGDRLNIVARAHIGTIAKMWGCGWLEGVVVPEHGLIGIALTVPAAQFSDACRQFDPGFRLTAWTCSVCGFPRPLDEDCDFKGRCAECAKERSTILAKESGDDRRIREARAPGSHSEEQWQALLMRFKFRCVRCRVHARATREGFLTRDHVIPLVKGGSHDISNIQPLCKSCNSRKGTQIQDYRDHRRTQLTEVLPQPAVSA